MQLNFNKKQPKDGRAQPVEKITIYTNNKNINKLKNNWNNHLKEVSKSDKEGIE